MSTENTPQPGGDGPPATEIAPEPSEDILQKEGRAIASLSHEISLTTVVSNVTSAPVASSAEPELQSSTETTESPSSTTVMEMSTPSQISSGPESTTAEAGETVSPEDVEQPSDGFAPKNREAEIASNNSTEPSVTSESFTPEAVSTIAPSLPTTVLSLASEVTTIGEMEMEATTQSAQDMSEEVNVTSVGVTDKSLPEESITLAVVTTTDAEVAGTTLSIPNDISSDETTSNIVNNPSYDTTTDAITTTISSDIVDTATNTNIPSDTSTKNSDDSTTFYATTIPNTSSTFEEEYVKVTTQGEEMEFTTSAENLGEEKLTTLSSDEMQIGAVTTQRIILNTTMPIRKTSVTESSLHLNDEVNEMKSQNASSETQEENGNILSNDGMVTTTEFFTQIKNSTKDDSEKTSMIEIAKILATEKLLVAKFNHSPQFENESNKTDEELMKEVQDIMETLKKASHTPDKNTNATSGEKSSNEAGSVTNIPLAAEEVNGTVVNETEDVKSKNIEEGTNPSKVSIEAREMFSNLKPENNSSHFLVPSLGATKETEENVPSDSQSDSAATTSAFVSTSSSGDSDIIETGKDLEEIVKKNENESSISLTTKSFQTEKYHEYSNLSLKQETKTENNSVTLSDKRTSPEELPSARGEKRARNFKNNESVLIAQDKKTRRLHPFVLIEDDLGELNVTNDLDNSVGPLGQFIQLVSKPPPPPPPVADTLTKSGVKKTATKPSKTVAKSTKKTKVAVDCLPPVLRVARRQASSSSSSTTPVPDGKDGIVVVLPSAEPREDPDASDVLLVYPCAAPQQRGGATTEKTMVVLAHTVGPQEQQTFALLTDAAPTLTDDTQENQLDHQVENTVLSTTHAPSVQSTAIEEKIEGVKMETLNAELPEAKEDQAVPSMSTTVTSKEAPAEETVKNVKVLPVNAHEYEKIEVQPSLSTTTQVPSIQTPPKETVKDVKMSVIDELPEAKDVQGVGSTTTNVPSVPSSAEATMVDIMSVNDEQPGEKDVQDVLSVTTQLPPLQTSGKDGKMPVNSKQSQTKNGQFVTTMTTHVPSVQTPTENIKMLPVKTGQSEAKEVEDAFAMMTQLPTVHTTTENVKILHVNSKQSDTKEGQDILSMTDDPSTQMPTKTTIENANVMPVNAELPEAKTVKEKAMNQQMTVNSPMTEVSSKQTLATKTVSDVQDKVLDQQVNSAGTSSAKEVTSVQIPLTHSAKEEKILPQEAAPLQMKKVQEKTVDEQVKNVITSSTTEDPSEPTSTSETAKDVKTADTTRASTHEEGNSVRVDTNQVGHESDDPLEELTILSPSEKIHHIFTLESEPEILNDTTPEIEKQVTPERNHHVTTTQQPIHSSHRPFHQPKPTKTTTILKVDKGKESLVGAVTARHRGVFRPSRPHFPPRNRAKTDSFTRSPTSSTTTERTVETTPIGGPTEQTARIPDVITDVTTSTNSYSDVSPSEASTIKPVFSTEISIDGKTRTHFPTTRFTSAAAKMRGRISTVETTSTTETSTTGRQETSTASNITLEASPSPATSTTTEASSKAGSSEGAAETTPTPTHRPLRPRDRFTLFPRRTPPYILHPRRNNSRPANFTEVTTTAATVTTTQSAPPQVERKAPPRPFRHFTLGPAHAPAHGPVPANGTTESSAETTTSSATSSATTAEPPGATLAPTGPRPRHRFRAPPPHLRGSLRVRTRVPHGQHAPPQGALSQFPVPLRSSVSGSVPGTTLDSVAALDSPLGSDVTGDVIGGVADGMDSRSVSSSPNGETQSHGSLHRGASGGAAGRTSSAVPPNLVAVPLRPSVTDGVVRDVDGRVTAAVPLRPSVTDHVAGDVDSGQLHSVAQDVSTPPALPLKHLLLLRRRPLLHFHTPRPQEEQTLAHHLLQEVPDSLGEDAGHQASKRNSPRSEIAPTTAPLALAAPSTTTTTAAPARSEGFWGMITAMLPFGARLRAKTPFRPNAPTPPTPSTLLSTEAAALSTNSLEQAPVATEEQRRPLPPPHRLWPAPPQPLRQMLQRLALRAHAQNTRPQPPVDQQKLSQHETQQLTSNSLHQTSVSGNIISQEKLHEEIVHQQIPEGDEHLSGPKKTLQQVLHSHQAITQPQQEQPDEMVYHLVHQSERKPALHSPGQLLQPPPHETSHNEQIHRPEAPLLQPTVQTHEEVAATTLRPSTLQWLKIDQPSFGPMGGPERPVGRAKRA